MSVVGGLNLMHRSDRVATNSQYNDYIACNVFAMIEHEQPKAQYHD